MTLRLAGFQHFCARFADAFLTSLNPLTYERGDALQAFEEENEVHEPSDGFRAAILRGQKIVAGEEVDPPAKPWELDLLGSIDPSPTASPVCGEGPTGACDIPPSPPVGHPTFQLPMYDAKDLEAIAAEYIAKGYPDGSAEKSRLVAQLIISHLTYELQGLAYDQSHPETQK